METYTFSQCVRLLDIDPKVFRRWIREDLSLGEHDQISRADSRVRYLTREQLEQLAQLHDKILPANDHLVGEDGDEPITPGAYKLLADRLLFLEKSTESIQKDWGHMRRDLISLIEEGAEANLQHMHELLDGPEGVFPRLNALDRRSAEMEAHTHPPDPEQQRAEEVAHYKQRIAELETELAKYQQSEKVPSNPTHKQQDTMPSLKKRPTRKRKSAIKALPKTLIARSAFAKLHNISEKLVSKASLEGKVITVEGKWLLAGHVVTRALNERGRHDFYQVFHQRPDFRPCDQCPHEPISK